LGGGGGWERGEEEGELRPDVSTPYFQGEGGEKKQKKRGGGKEEGRVQVAFSLVHKFKAREKKQGGKKKKKRRKEEGESE